MAILLAILGFERSRQNDLAMAALVRSGSKGSTTAATTQISDGERQQESRPLAGGIGKLFFNLI